MCGGDEKAGCARWAEQRRVSCPSNTEEILEGRNPWDGTFPPLFVADGFEASARLAVQSYLQGQAWLVCPRCAGG